MTVSNNIIAQDTTKTKPNFKQQIDTLEKDLLECHIFSDNIVQILRITKEKVKNGEVAEKVLIDAIAVITKTSEDQNLSIEQKNKKIERLEKKLSKKKLKNWLSACGGFVVGIGVVVVILEIAKAVTK